MHFSLAARTSVELRSRAGELMTLRERAERRLERARPDSSGASDIPEYELQLHQLELEMQNEELRRALFEIEASQARYFQLFDLAPIAYVTLDRYGVITEANFAAGVILRENRRKLIGQRLSAFIASSSADAYTLRLREVLAGGDLRQLELDLATPPIPVRFTYNAIRKAEPTEEILGVRLAIIDLTELRETCASLIRERHHLEAIRALASGIARELGSLFTNVNGYLDLALDYLGTNRAVRPYLEELRRFIDGGNAIVRRLQALEHGAVLDVPVR